MILFNNVSKKFGSTLALEDINLEVKQGEFIFLVGPSGAGKSTLLRILTHEYLPSTGKVMGSIMMNDECIMKNQIRMNKMFLNIHTFNH